MLTHRKFLALSVTEQAVSAVEVEPSPGGGRFLHSVQVPFTQELNLAAPEPLGKALKQALRQAGVQASRCAVGLAASFLASREKVLPATDAESLRGVLNITAEREFASGPQELAFDYCTSALGANIAVLMMAAPRWVLENLAAMAAAAGLHLAAVTSSSVVLAAATQGPVPASGRLVLCLLEDGAELTLESPDGLRQVRRLGVRMDRPGEAAQLASELRRVLAQAPPPLPGEREAGGVRELLVWNPCGHDRSLLDPLSGLGLNLRFCEAARDLGLSNVPANASGDRFAQAMAMGRFAEQAPAIDFTHSRLAAQKKSRLSKPAKWGIAAGAVLVVGLAWVVWDWQAAQQAAEEAQLERDANKAKVQEARAVIDNVTFARSWFDRRPKFIDCLLEITQAFPVEGKIYATTLVVREDMQTLLTGKATSRGAVDEVVDRLQANPRLTEVKLQYSRPAGGTSRDVAFAINLSFRGAPK